MTKYRSAQGKVVDMAALAAKNEKTRAVGNMKVNARGDTIDSNGKIIIPVTAKVNDRYSKTVGNRSSHVVNKNGKTHKAPITPSGVTNKPAIQEIEELTEYEKELEESFEDDLEVEQIKAKELEEINGKETSIPSTQNKTSYPFK
jgi:hypothetical protein